ncbi:hypothetical protein BJ742DRAFT_776409 [Cladochytrium replicatum]|nr:hypothetical protein BJ742DRAFT_776409 [Cladochytrium replicatum]
MNNNERRTKLPTSVQNGRSIIKTSRAASSIGSAKSRTASPPSTSKRSSGKQTVKTTKHSDRNSERTSCGKDSSAVEEVGKNSPDSTEQEQRKYCRARRRCLANRVAALEEVIQRLEYKVAKMNNVIVANKLERELNQNTTTLPEETISVSKTNQGHHYHSPGPNESSHIGYEEDLSPTFENKETKFPDNAARLGTKITACYTPAPTDRRSDRWGVLHAQRIPPKFAFNAAPNASTGFSLFYLAYAMRPSLAPGL